jgi:hypothetical protein
MGNRFFHFNLGLVFSNVNIFINSIQNLEQEFITFAQTITRVVPDVDGNTVLLLAGHSNCLSCPDMLCLVVQQPVIEIS